ncbi:MAG: hypothetical protein RL385_2495 [Pseudomonadota bacterium]|jgi:hypothetical protein
MSMSHGQSTQRFRAEILDAWRTMRMRAAHTLSNASESRARAWIARHRQGAYFMVFSGFGLGIAAWPSALVPSAKASALLLAVPMVLLLIADERRQMRALQALHAKVDRLLSRAALEERPPLDADELDDSSLRAAYAKVALVAANLESEIAIRRAFCLPKPAPFVRIAPPPLPRKTSV